MKLTDWVADSNRRLAVSIVLAVLTVAGAIVWEVPVADAPTRVDVLRAVAVPLNVWTDHLTGESYIAENGPKVSAHVFALESVGLIAERESFWWITPAGVKALAELDAKETTQ